MADAEKLTAWLADDVCSRERQAQRVREALLARLREEQVEQPTRIRLGRMVGSALLGSAIVSAPSGSSITGSGWPSTPQADTRVTRRPPRSTTCAPATLCACGS